MEALRVLSKVYIIFICLTGYVFGQLFFEKLSFDATIIAIGGITAVYMWNEKNLKVYKKTVTIFVAALITLISCTYETYYYYNYLNNPGNNFAWPMRAPFYLMLFLILINSALHLSSSKFRKNENQNKT